MFRLNEENTDASKGNTRHNADLMTLIRVMRAILETLKDIVLKLVSTLLKRYELTWLQTWLQTWRGLKETLTLC